MRRIAGTISALAIALAVLPSGATRSEADLDDDSASDRVSGHAILTALDPDVPDQPRVIPDAKRALDPAAEEEGTPSKCRNSFEPECGPFRWTRDPGVNDPLQIDVTISPSSPRVGDVITVDVHAVDPDAPISQVPVEFDLPKIGTALFCRARYGSWDPPARRRGEFTATYHHVYEKAGDYTVDVWVVSGAWECMDPYGDAAIKRFPIVVAPAGDEPTYENSEDAEDPSGEAVEPCVGVGWLVCKLRVAGPWRSVSVPASGPRRKSLRSVERDVESSEPAPW